MLFRSAPEDIIGNGHPAVAEVQNEIMEWEGKKRPAKAAYQFMVTCKFPDAIVQLVGKVNQYAQDRKDLQRQEKPANVVFRQVNQAFKAQAQGKIVAQGHRNQVIDDQEQGRHAPRLEKLPLDVG